MVMLTKCNQPKNDEDMQMTSHCAVDKRTALEKFWNETSKKYLEQLNEVDRLDI